MQAGWDLVDPVQTQEPAQQHDEDGDSGLV
jgi:hypothetical protein